MTDSGLAPPAKNSRTQYEAPQGQGHVRTAGRRIAHSFQVPGHGGRKSGSGGNAKQGATIRQRAVKEAGAAKS